MVHVATPRPSIGAALGEALGSYGARQLHQHVSSKNEQEQKSKFNQALQDAEEIFTNPNLTQEQKLFGLNNALREHPELAKNLISQSQNQQKIDVSKQKLGQGQQLFSQLFGTNQPQSNQQNQQQNQALPQQQQQIDPQNPSSWPEELVNKARAFAGQPGDSGIIGQMAENEFQNRLKDKSRSWELEDLARKEETEVSKPILLELNEARKNIPLQEQAIEDIKNTSPEVGWQDYIADVTGYEPLRSAKGAKLKTALKDFFLSDLSRAGARPNQWIEQQLADALPKLGRSAEANLTVAEGMNFKVDLAKKRIEIIDKLAEEDKKKYGYVKGDIDSRAYKEMLPYVKYRQTELRNSIRKIQKENNTKKMTPEIALNYLNKAKGNREEAEKLARNEGYEF
jgi:hypothetical protein